MTEIEKGTGIGLGSPTILEDLHHPHPQLVVRMKRIHIVRSRRPDSTVAKSTTGIIVLDLRLHPHLLHRSMQEIATELLRLAGGLASQNIEDRF